MKRHQIILLMAVIFFASGLMALGRYMQAKNKDMFWTPPGKMESWAAGAKYVRLYVLGESLENLLEKQQIVLKSKEGESDLYFPIKKEQVTVRINHKVEMMKSQITLASGLFGLSIGLLLSGLVCVLSKKGKGKE